MFRLENYPIIYLHLSAQKKKTMFFVGASGQILTLILTVCLPFVFLLSGHQKINIEQSTLSFDIHQNLEISSFDFNSTDIEQECSAEIDVKIFDFLEFEFIKIPHEYIQVNQKPISLNSSGNKAPPVSYYFYC